MMQCFCSEEEDEEDEEDEELDEEEKQRIGGIFSKVIAGHDEEDSHIEEVSICCLFSLKKLVFTMYCSPFITLYLGFINVNRVIKGQFYKGIIGK